MKCGTIEGKYTYTYFGFQSPQNIFLVAVKEIAKTAEGQELIKIAALADELQGTAPKVAEPQEQLYEDGKISELERLQHYYCKAIKVAATYATMLEQFVPVYRDRSNPHYF